MTKKLYFFSEKIDTAKDIVRQLKNRNIDDKSIGVISSEQNIAFASLPNPKILDELDASGLLIKGGAVGFFIGTLTWILVQLLSSTSELDPLVLLFFGLIGGILGAWTVSSFGASEYNPVLEEYRPLLKHGGYLTVVDSNIDNKEANRLINEVSKTSRISQDQCGLYSGDY